MTSLRFPHAPHRLVDQPDSPTARGRPAGVDWGEVLRKAERACCCSASPVVVAVYCTEAGTAPNDILLCGHHYRLCRKALAAKHATVYDEHGAPVSNPWVR